MKSLLLTLLLAAAALAQTTPPPSDPALDLVKQGRKLNTEGKQDEALALYRKAIEISPSLYEAHLSAGMALDLQAKYNEAREELKKAIELAPPHSKRQALSAMAISYAFECKAADASKYEQQAFDNYVADQKFLEAGEVANEMGRIYLECGDPDHAAKWYKSGYETAQKKPGLTEAERALWTFRWEHAQARIAARRGKKDEAQQHVAAAKVALEKAENPDQARFLPYLTGYVAFYAGDYKTAIADLQKADQRDPFILSLLAQAYEKSGDKTQAVEYYKKVLASNVHNPTNAFARPLAKKKLS